MRVTPQTTLENLLKYPKAVKVLAKYQLPCLFCPALSFELGYLTLAQVAELYGLPLEKLLQELNATLKE